MYVYMCVCVCVVYLLCVYAYLIAFIIWRIVAGLTRIIIEFCFARLRSTLSVPLDHAGRNDTFTSSTYFHFR